MTSVAADSRRRFITGPGAASIGGLAHAAVEPTNFGAAHRRHFQLRVRQPQGPCERVARGLKWSEALSRKWLYRKLTTLQ
jgi:hypothetical protein